MKRIILHWTAGRAWATSLDREHYHFLVQQNGVRVTGIHEVRRNAAPRSLLYAAHTRGANTDSIGLALCGMMAAVESPFSEGPEPINQKQWLEAAKWTAELCKHYGIPVTRQTVLSHAEVQITLKIAQNGKWDITRLPWNSKVTGALACGDLFRAEVVRCLGEQGQAATEAVSPTLVVELPATKESVEMIPFIPPLVGMAISIVPELAKLVLGQKSAAVVETVADVVKKVTGTDDESEAKAALEQAGMQEVLRAALDKELEVYKIGVEDTQNARQQTIELAKAGSGIAWGPVLISALVVCGFFSMLTLLLTKQIPPNEVTLVLMGALSQGFGQVLNYWLGSSNGSQQKNATIERAMARQSKDN